ncbi:MAG: FecR family protein [Flavisolibacter sp.]
MPKNYETYSAAEFLEDAFFIEWIKYQTPEAEQFWRAWLHSGPANAGALRAAELQLRALLSAQRIAGADTEAVQVWERVQLSLQEQPATVHESKVRKLRRTQPLYRTWWAAAVLLFVIVGLWFLAGRDKSVSPPIAAAPMVQQDIAPGGNKAILMLADGSKVLLDTAGNGALTKQGNVTVIKLNGQLAYNRQGSSAAEVLFNTVTTPRGGQYQLILADGTKVWLNAESSLHFPTVFNGKERKVALTGEGYFEVAHNEEKPFHVTVNDMDVQVLGTHFNINAYSDEAAVKTTLLQGRVKVSKRGQTVLLYPGQQAQAAATSPGIKVMSDVNLDEVMAWKNGYFSFHNADIQTVMSQFARWYNVTVEYKGAVPQRAFEGEIQRDLVLSQALKLLEKNHVHFRVEDKKIIVTP